MLIIDSTKREENHMTNEEFLSLYVSSPWKKILYIHTPFCPSKCRYCICKSVACNSQQKIDNFVGECLIPQIKAVTSTLSQISFSEVYFGGGTPTSISPHMLKLVFDSIPNFRRIPKKCIECSPNTISYEHLELFKEYEFSFISVGIQSLQKDVCDWQNRVYLSKPQIVHLSEVLKQTGIYFNYDLISYLGKGDFRDIPGFEADLQFIMSECEPSSINIHQLHQTTFTTEKMLRLYKVLLDAMSKFPDYECINAHLKDSDAYNDIVFQSQFRLVREKRDFTHYMWNKYPEIPVMGFDIFAIGNTESVFPKSNAGNISYRPGKNTFKTVEFNLELYKEYYKIRREKGLK